MSVLVQDAAESITSADVEMVEAVRFGDRQEPTARQAAGTEADASGGQDMSLHRGDLADDRTYQPDSPGARRYRARSTALICRDPGAGLHERKRPTLPR
jgi:hypothetical protein